MLWGITSNVTSLIPWVSLFPFVFAHIHFALIITIPTRTIVFLWVKICSVTFDLPSILQGPYLNDVYTILRI